MLTLIVSVAILIAVVGASAQWAVRTERRRDIREEGHAGHH
jgi:nitrogen fixation-related uncharacterized protein